MEVAAHSKNVSNAPEVKEPVKTATEFGTNLGDILSKVKDSSKNNNTNKKK